jgi:hypothetical protein
MAILQRHWHSSVTEHSRVAHLGAKEQAIGHAVELVHVMDLQSINAMYGSENTEPRFRDDHG